MDIVLKLRELRRLRGLSQKDVGRLSGVGEKTVSSFETGDRTDSMKLSQLRKLLRVYNITEDEFFSRRMDELFDPESLLHQTREDILLAGPGSTPASDARRTPGALRAHAAGSAARGGVTAVTDQARSSRRASHRSVSAPRSRLRTCRDARHRSRPFARMLVEAGKVLGVDVLDHLILCANRVRLTKQRGMM
jgi:transcriptional regulator with XRE-family HTH domain